MTRWLAREWWAYLLAPKPYYTRWTTAIWCRMRGHPDGEIFYNVNGGQKK